MRVVILLFGCKISACKCYYYCQSNITSLRFILRGVGWHPRDVTYVISDYIPYRVGLLITLYLSRYTGNAAHTARKFHQRITI